MIAMSEKKNMTTEIYEEKRNDLIRLLGESAERIDDQAEVTKKALGGICEATCGRLNGIAEDLRRNCFEIVLVGEFQGGKSTTFDALCDGRDISPRGIGIKTSACRISAQSVSKTEDECAILNWKSDDELMLTMYELVRDNVAEDEEGVRLFPYERPDKLPSLSDRRVRELAKRAIAREWEIYRQVPGAYGGEEDDGRLDLLKMSTLILKYYGTPELDRLREKTQIGIEELKSFVVFPHDWAIRWQKEGEDASWSLTESAFAFLGSVDCHIHSPNLGRLGCVVTDCPGLFAGPWDTKVAEEAMERADAILYLMRGNKTIGDEDVRALRKILQNQQGDKLFFAINANGTIVDRGDEGLLCVRQNVIENLRVTDLSVLQRIGVKNVKCAEDLDVFNALLAFKSKETREEGEEASRRWRRVVETALRNYLGLDSYDDEDGKRIRELLTDSKELEKESGFLAIRRKVETDIVGRKFERVLVDRGTQQLSNALNGIEGELRGLEKAAEDKYDTTKGDVEKARKDLAEFQSFVENGIKEVLNEADDAAAVCDDCYHSVFWGNCKIYAYALSATIAQKMNILNRTKLACEQMGNAMAWAYNKIANGVRWLCGKDTVKFEPDNTWFREILGEPICSTMRQVTEAGISGWTSEVAHGRNRTFSVHYGRALQCLRKDVEERWKVLVNEKSALHGILDGMNMDVTQVGIIQLSSGVFSDGQAAEAVQKTVHRFAFLDIMLHTMLTLIWPLLFPVFKLILKLMSDGQSIRRDWLASKISNQLERTLFGCFSDEKNRNIILNELNAKVLRHILDRILENCQNALADQRKRFEENVRKLLAAYELAEEERRRIAAIAKEVRETVIAPMQHKAESFNEELLPYFKGNEV